MPGGSRPACGTCGVEPGLGQTRTLTVTRSWLETLESPVSQEEVKVHAQLHLTQVEDDHLAWNCRPEVSSRAESRDGQRYRRNARAKMTYSGSQHTGR